MPTITFTLNDFLELVGRSRGGSYPVLGYGVFESVCPMCRNETVHAAMLGTSLNYECDYCGNRYPMAFGSDHNHDGGGVRPVGAKYSILTP